mmetsp:Transcript_2732/g.10714  ORF Transcript_2732/g.10714 Transcript_2732/m.10714 type:complete len:342 (-) Transcript_2732:394-1419(-)
MPKKRGGGQSKSLTLEELSANFHLPINDVARKLGLCVTVLKQRCREHGITRWPYRKVKKLDNIIHALECPGDGGVADATRRLETVKRTREVLITDPNSKAHLRVGKLKAVRRRSLGSKSGYGSGGSGSDNSGGTAFGVMRHPQNSSGIDGLLEAATTLSDGETPGTPTREPDAIRDRSPRISGALQTLTGPHMASGVNDADTTPAGAEAAALALNALKPGGAFQAARAAVDVANKAAAPAAPVFDANAYAAAMAAFAGHVGNAAAAAATPPPAPPTPANPMAALMANPMFAWMAAMGNVAQAQAQAAQAAATPPAPNFLQMAAAAAAAAQAAQPQSAHQPL